MFHILQHQVSYPLAPRLSDANQINFSLLQQFSRPAAFRSFSIKYVAEGAEYYQVNGADYPLRNGEYLLANATCRGSVVVDSHTVVKGVCIDVSSGTLAEVLEHWRRPDAPIPEPVAEVFFTSERFVENQYHTAHTQLGRVLEPLGKRLMHNPQTGFRLGTELFYQLAEALVLDHLPVIHALHNIHVVKHQTRKDLYRRLARGKQFLEAMFQEKTSVADAARHAALSEYHFYRLFRSAFGYSPQQYLIRVRMRHAKELLESGHYNVGDTALACGYLDIYHFSHAYRKFYGVPPSTALVGKKTGLYK
jgi:AraC family transcriptional regulator